MRAGTAVPARRRPAPPPRTPPPLLRRPEASATPRPRTPGPTAGGRLGPRPQGGIGDTQRQRHLERGALPLNAVDTDGAAMEVDQFLHKASPMPLPSKLRPRAPSMRRKRSNRCGNFRRGIAGPCVPHLQHKCAILRAQAHRDLTLEGEFERVGEQVQNDLLPTCPGPPGREPAAAGRRR